MIKFAAKFQTMMTTRERGATAVEYGLMVALIAIVIIGAVTFLGGKIQTLFSNAGSSI